MEPRPSNFFPVFAACALLLVAMAAAAASPDYTSPWPAYQGLDPSAVQVVDDDGQPYVEEYIVEG